MPETHDPPGRAWHALAADAAVGPCWPGRARSARAASRRRRADPLYTPPLNAMFHTVPLPLESLLPLLALASLVLWVEEGRKWMHRLHQGPAP